MATLTGAEGVCVTIRGLRRFCERWVMAETRRREGRAWRVRKAIGAIVVGREVVTRAVKKKTDGIAGRYSGGDHMRM